MNFAAILPEIILTVGPLGHLTQNAAGSLF